MCASGLGRLAIQTRLRALPLCKTRGEAQRRRELEQRPGVACSARPGPLLSQQGSATTFKPPGGGRQAGSVKRREEKEEKRRRKERRATWPSTAPRCSSRRRLVQLWSVRPGAGGEALCLAWHRAQPAVRPVEPRPAPARAGLLRPAAAPGYYLPLAAGLARMDAGETLLGGGAEEAAAPQLYDYSRIVGPVREPALPGPRTRRPDGAHAGNAQFPAARHQTAAQRYNARLLQAGYYEPER